MQAQGFKKYTVKEAESFLKSELNHFGIEGTDKEFERLAEMVEVHNKLKRNAYLPDKEVGESDDDYIRRVYESKGKMDAIIVIGQLKGLGLRDAKEYADKL